MYNSFAIDTETTNNKAERALRETVVQRKIYGCLRNKKRDQKPRYIDKPHNHVGTTRTQPLQPATGPPQELNTYRFKLSYTIIFPLRVSIIDHLRVGLL